MLDLLLFSIEERYVLFCCSISHNIFSSVSSLTLTLFLLLMPMAGSHIAYLQRQIVFVVGQKDIFERRKWLDCWQWLKGFCCCHPIWTYTIWWPWNNQQYMFLDLMVTRYFDKKIILKRILQRISEYDMYVGIRLQQSHNAVTNLFCNHHRQHEYYSKMENVDM